MDSNLRSLGASKRNILLWLSLILAIVVVFSIAAFWVFPAINEGNSNDSRDVDYSGTDPYTYDPGEIDPNLNSNSQSSFQIDEVNSYLDDFSHVAQLYAFLAESNEATLLDLLDASTSIASASRRDALQAAIVRKYASVNPHRAFERIRTFPIHQQDALLANVFHEWSILSVNEAVEIASTLDGRLRHLVLQTILETRDDLSDTSRQDIAERLGGVDFAKSLLAEEQAMARMVDPREAWNTMVKDGLKNRSRVDAYVRIAVEWATLEGLEVLNEIAETLTEDVDYYNHVRDNVVIAVAQTGVVDTFKFVSTLDEDMQQELLRPVVLAWANIDPAAALKAVDELENNPLTDLIERITANQWIGSNPKEILPLLDTYSQPVRSIAMETVATTLIRTKPLEALRLIQEWGNDGIDMTSVARGVIQEWSQLDPKAALEWLLSEKPDDWVNYAAMMETTLRGLAPVDPTLAFETALKQPLPEEYMSGPEAWVVLELSRSDLDKATELLPLVRESSKTIASLWVGEALVDNGKPFEALDLAEFLPEDRRDRFYYDMFKHWGERDAVELFETLDTLSSTVFQSNAAKSLIWISRWDSILTKSQLEVVHSYLTDEHAEQVEGWRNL